MPKIKVCGITSYGDAKAAFDLGVDALGFNFYPQSPRYIEPKAAAEIIKKLPRMIWLVGVFVNLEQKEVLRIAHKVGLDTLQFHGDEDEEYVSVFEDWRTIKALRLGAELPVKRIADFTEVVDYLLYDKFDPLAFGGTGQQIDQVILDQLKTQGLFARAFLSGGITPQNAAAKIDAYQPIGIDVASGVETEPGKKDLEKMKALVEAVRGN
jgi:phosphoribosylanthranilate isomerase